MSSHHIVRENQEPALIVASADAVEPEYLGQLLEWSPTLISNDYAADFLLAQEIKVDFVFAEKPVTYTQEQINVLPLQKDFLSEALSYLIENNYNAVNIIAEAVHSGLTAFCPQINVVLLTPGKRTVFVRYRFEKWTEKGRRIYVDEGVLTSSAGLRKIAMHVFETEHDGFFCLVFNTDEFIAVGEDL